MMEEQANGKTRKQARADEAGTMYRRIGNTLFKVRVFTSVTGSETAGGKIMRLIRYRGIDYSVEFAGCTVVR